MKAREPGRTGLCPRGLSESRCDAPAFKPSLPRTALFTTLMGVLTMAPSGAALALDIKYDAVASVLHSDNIRLSETGEIDETVVSPQLNFEATQTGSAVQMTVRGNVEYLHYLQNTFDDEVRGELSGHLNWAVVPERIDFVVKDYLSRQPVNVLTSFNPDNQQQINFFIAGPNFYARFNDATRAQLDLRYSNTYAEETKTFNGDRYSATARVLHEISPSSQLSANLEATQVDFDLVGLASDYNRYDGYVNYTRDLAAVHTEFDLGYSRLELKRDGRSSSSPLVRGQMDWFVSARSTFSAQVRYQFADAAESLAARAGQLTGPIISNLSNPSLLVSPDVYRQRRLELGYQFIAERLTLQLRPYYERNTYEGGLARDQSNRGGYVQLDYRLRPRMSLTLLASRDNRSFDEISQEDNDTTLQVGLINQISRNWSWRVDFQHRRRDSSVFNQSYDENEAAFAITYRR